jgi:flagellar protein FlbD
LNNSEFVLNANHIESLEATPDTVITLSNERKMIVKEKLDEVKDKILEYQKKIFQCAYLNQQEVK